MFRAHLKEQAVKQPVKHLVKQLMLFGPIACLEYGWAVRKWITLVFSSDEIISNKDMLHSQH